MQLLVRIRLSTKKCTFKYFIPTSMHTHTYRPAIYIIYKKTIIKRYILNYNVHKQMRQMRHQKKNTHIYIYTYHTN